MNNPDGSVIIATLLDTDGIEKGTIEIKKELLDVEKSAEKADDAIGGDLVSGFKKLGKAIAAAGVIDMLVDFGKEAIELGSDLEEVQNVVDVTFETMSDSVNQFAKDAKKSAGLSEKMAKQYVGTFGAMADSFGFTELEAYEMSTALTQLTGDVASFYNLSQDEAMNKLEGVFTGETEAIKELGVVMTQAALDNYALANGLSKTTSEMTEQEKVALRYQFVMDQLSAASGDFVRTQDSWANQSKVLALQWESFMATIGSGLIDVLLPGVQFLNDKMLPALQDVADWLVKAWDPTPSQKLADELKKVTKTAQTAGDQFEETSKEIETNAIMAGVYKERLEELETAGLNSADAQTAYAAVVSQLNELFPELNLQINEQTGLLDENSRAQLANIDAMKQKYLLLAVEEQITEVLRAQGDAQAAVNKALYDQEAVTGALVAKEAELISGTNKTVEEMLSLYNATQLSAGVVQNMDGSVVALTADQMALASEVIALRSEQENLTVTIADGKEVVSSLDSEVTELYESYGIAVDSAEDFEKSQEDVSAAVAEANSKVEELRSEYNEAKDAARSSIDAQIGLFDELTIKSDKSAEDIIKNWQSQQAALDEYKVNLEKAINMGLDEALVKQLSDGSEESMAILNEFVNGTDLSVDDINAAFRKTEESKDAVSATMADIQTDMSEKLNQLEKEVSDSLGDQADAVKREIQNMQKEINSLQGKTVTIRRNYVSSYSGGSSGSSGSTPSGTSGYALNTASVPFLAKGTVIPPNAPFMAVLGDQRHGTNVEAPLSTIQEAVANVMGDTVASNMAGHEATVAVLREILQAVLCIEIGDSVIGAAAERYNEQMAIVRGGRL